MSSGKRTPSATPEATVTGWRWWMVTTNGELSGFHTPYARIPWKPRIPTRAICNHEADDHGPYDAPHPDCECGIRIMPNLDDLLDGLVDNAARTGITPDVFHVIGGPAYLTDRRRHGVHEVPDVIGQVIGEGRIEDACPWDDPPGTVRAEYARPGTILYLSRHLARRAPALRHRYAATVHVGHARGLDWLDEIAAAIGV
jgi:hypothetical protein